MGASSKTSAQEIDEVVENLLDQDITLDMLADPDGGVPDDFLKASSTRAYSRCVSSPLCLSCRVGFGQEIL